MEVNMADSKIKMQVAADRCKGCGLCVSVCPEATLALNTDQVNSKGYYPVAVAADDSCIGCLSCALICPDVIFTIERLVDREEC